MAIEPQGTRTSSNSVLMGILAPPGLSLKSYSHPSWRLCEDLVCGGGKARVEGKN